MKPKLSVRFLLCWLITLPVMFTACVKDTCEQEEMFSMYFPVYKSTAAVIAGIRSEPANPIKQAGKIYIRGNYIFMNDRDRGIHIIDNSRPSAPRNVAFIPIPGNVDLAVKGNYLYADMYTQLLTIDISDPLNVKLKDNKYMFPQRLSQSGFYRNPDEMIVSYIKRDTLVRQSCDDRHFLVMNDALVTFSSTAPNPFGSGGSMARFTIINDLLYTVSNDSLSVLDISSPALPEKKNTIRVGWGIETIYPFKNQLFIGSTTGMFRYNLTNPYAPDAAGQFAHVQSCDPVIADDNYAYVTLRSGSFCQGFSNELNILSLSAATGGSFTLLKKYDLTNPHGLGKDGNLLMICDGADGLKIFDASDVNQLKQLKRIPMDAYDIIMQNKIALVVSRNGIYQFDYSNPADVKQLSRLSIQNN